MLWLFTHCLQKNSLRTYREEFFYVIYFLSIVVITKEKGVVITYLVLNLSMIIADSR